MRAGHKNYREEGHVVFDFTGLEQGDATDLAMILTARLHSAPGESVWVRSLPHATARLLEYLRLDHLFLHCPEDQGQPN